MLKNKKILITGGTGSFGSSVAKKLLKMNIGELTIFSRDELKQYELREKISDKRLKFIIGDVRDEDSVFSSLKNIDYVFHAAALKQVPSCEFYPLEAIKTNILGANNVLNGSILNRVKKVVFLSTDKAVYPINAMGLSKSLMEKVIVANSRNSSYTKFCITRYGNVLGSRGSILPVVLQQIKTGKNITITDPKMTRFIMTLDDSVDLVLTALKLGKNGDTFVQKAPACSIIDLINALKSILNKKNYKIKKIGVRHGEKNHEVLVSKEEMLRAKKYKNYFVISADNRNLNYSKFFSKGNSKIDIVKEYSSNNTSQLTQGEIKKILNKVL